jgi:hypothetical protein
MASFRQNIVGRLQRRLEQDGQPRLQMTLLVALTGGVGFLCSVALLHAGLDELWLRYLLSVGAAYLAFLSLLWLWMRISAPSYIDARDLRGLTSVDQSWDDHWTESSPQRGPSLTDVVGVELELALPLLVIVFLGTLLIACCYIVYGAPLLFAELMLDGVLAATLYQRLRTLDARHWLETALRHTWPTFLLAAVIMVVAGLAMTQYLPSARSIGEVLRQLLA